jgi:YNFM family putative membrane transporter
MGPFLLGASAMFAAMYSTQAILPALGRAFHVSPAQTGLTVSIVIGALAAGSWFWGPLSDRIGRRASLVLSSAAMVPPTLAAALAPSFGVLLALRGVQGLCMPGLLAVGVPYVTEAYVPRLGARAMGLYVSSLVAGGLVGRVGVALVTAAAGWRAGMAAVTVLPLAAALVMRRRLPPEDPPAAGGAGRSLARARELVTSPALIGPILVGSGLFFAFMGVFSYVDYRLEGPPFSLPQSLIGLVFVLWVFGGVGPVAGRLAGDAGWRRVALGGVGLAAAGVGLSLVDWLPALLACLGLVTMGNFSGVTAAQLGVSEATDTDRGLASAMYFSSYYVAGALGGWLPGLAWESGGWEAVALTVFAAYAVALAGLALTRRVRVQV